MGTLYNIHITGIFSDLDLATLGNLQTIWVPLLLPIMIFIDTVFFQMTGLPER